MERRDPRVAKIWTAIAKVLMNEWDPIGVRGVDEAKDEYDGYVGGAFRLLEAGAGEEELANHLHTIETNRMGISRDRAQCLVVARKLRDIPLQ